MMHEEKTCLLIDDDQEDQVFFQRALQRVSPATRLIVADDATAAIKILREEQPPDCIFLDLRLPGMDGYEFLLHLKRNIKHRRIPVIIYSVLSDPEKINHARKLGASDFLTKSHKTMELETLLVKYIKA